MSHPKIYIPKPCHENWNDMTLEQKGRFCNSCQKTVYDFTKSTDRMILEKFQSEENICGRFNTSQLDRELVIQKQKSTIWTAGITSVLSLVSFGNDKIYAQEKQPTLQTDQSVQRVKIGEAVASIDTRKSISGTVHDQYGLPLPAAKVSNKQTLVATEADFDGNFVIAAQPNDILVFSYPNMIPNEVIVTSETNTIELQLSDLTSDCSMIVGGAVAIQKRTFFGRIFHKIGNWFQ